MVHELRTKEKIFRKIPVFYLILLCITLAMLAFLDITQKSELVQNRTNQRYRIITVSSYQEIESSKAPAGLKKEYILKPGAISKNENCLAFYVVHHYVQVYIDEELIYSLMPAKGHTISKTTGCEWVLIPLSTADSGKEIRIVLTPAYKSVRNRHPEFLIGTRHSIIINTVKIDILDFTLSVLALGTGIIFVGISLFWLFQKRTPNSLLYLGIFSITLGAWKITDIRTVTMMFPEHALLLSQISLSMMSMASIPFILFIERQIDKKRWRFLNLACMISLITTTVQILLQALGMADLRESLTLTHGVIILTAIAVVYTVAAQLRSGSNNRQLKITCACFLMCAAGLGMDLVKYYLTGNSDSVLNTIAVFLLYIVIMGVMSMMDLTHQATVDFNTGLFNRSCCSEKVREGSVIQKETCLIMFDLNQLKKVNDTLGHEAGDEIIIHFAEILRQNIPASAFLGRYGGDEFISILESCDRDMADKILADISHETEKYNASDCKAAISFSAGYALSAEHPGCTMLTLMEKADEKMYENKKAFYDKLKKDKIR